MNHLFSIQQQDLQLNLADLNNYLNYYKIIWRNASFKNVVEVASKKICYVLLEK